MVSIIVLAVLPPSTGYEMISVVGINVYLIWNIYAFLNKKRMIPPINYKIDYSFDGNKIARLFLFGLCLILYIVIMTAWVTQRVA